MSKSLPTKRTADTVLGKLFRKKDLQYLAKNAQVILMVGMPGSGKSTISELFVSAYGFWRFSSDQIRTEELFPDQEHRLATQHEKVMAARQLVYQELARRAGEAVKQGQKVVIDSTNLDEKRDVLYKHLSSILSPEKICLVVVETPAAILEQRFRWEGSEQATKWHSVFEYWQKYLAEGKASYPVAKDYAPSKLVAVQRFDLETFDWITDIGVIVWDVDRTLYQPVPELNSFIQKRLHQLTSKQKKLSVDEAQAYFSARYQALHSSTLVLDELGLNGRQVIDHLFQEFPLEKYLKPDLRLKKLFQSLSQFHHVILSNSGLVTTQRKLQALGLPLTLFSAIYATYELPVIKPDKRVFEHVMKQTSFAPHQHLMIGDELHTDILPAKAVGMRTAWVTAQLQPESTQAMADIHFESVYQVGRLFGVEL